MKEYHKIETVFNRDIEGSKKLIEGYYRNDAVLFVKDLPWEFTEKIDGTNIRIMWDGHRISYGGRTEAANIPAHLMNRLIELFGNEETEQLFEQTFGEKEVILFGEGYGAKIQKGGGLYRSDASFILFDVMINGNYQPRSMVEQAARQFGLEVVPIVLVGTIADAVAFVKEKPMSTIGKAPMEGVVGRPMVELNDRCGNRLIVKIKVRDFA
jgi:hypothetical protein